MIRLKDIETAILKQRDIGADYVSVYVYIQDQLVLGLEFPVMPKVGIKPSILKTGHLCAYIIACLTPYLLDADNFTVTNSKYI